MNMVYGFVLNIYSYSDRFGYAVSFLINSVRYEKEGDGETVEECYVAAMTYRNTTKARALHDQNLSV